MKRFFLILVFMVLVSSQSFAGTIYFSGDSNILGVTVSIDGGSENMFFNPVSGEWNPTIGLISGDLNDWKSIKSADLLSIADAAYRIQIISIATGINPAAIIAAVNDGFGNTYLTGGAGNWDFNLSTSIDAYGTSFWTDPMSGSALATSALSAAKWVGSDDGLQVATLTFTTPSSTAPVPEPATILLLGTSLVGLCAYRKRRN